MNELAQHPNARCDEYPWTTTWYLKDLRSGHEADREGHKILPFASTRKIVILMAALKGVNEGRFTLDQPVEMHANYQDNTSGTFQHLSPGFTITFRDALAMMIIVSDNTCTGTVADMVGLDEVNALCQLIGMVGTTHRHGIPPNGMARDHPVDLTNAMTAADVGLLLETILRGTTDADAASSLGSTTELCHLGLDILSWQQLRQRLPAHLPEGTKVAHKTGTGRHNINDAGIIFGPDSEARYILTVYTDGIPADLPERSISGPGAASHQIAAMCRMCWDTLIA